MIRNYEDLRKVEIENIDEIKISDATLREGAQMPGVVIKSEDKLEIYKYLSKIGIEKVETFLYKDRDKKLAREMIDLGFEKPEVTGWIRAKKSDISLLNQFEEIQETGVLMSVSDCHIFDKMGFESREDAKDQYLAALQEVVDQGIRPRCHIEDVTRAEVEEFVFPFLEDVLEIAPNAIIRVCDTLNYGIPFYEKLPYSIPKLVEEIDKIGAKDIELHVHDDYGLGVANVLAGFEAGANWGNLTFMGLGERSGVAELEKVLLFLEDRLGVEKYDLSVLKEFADYLEENGNYHVPNNKALVGSNVFAHESGIHTDGVLKNPMTYEPYPPEKVGAKRKLFIGDSSGKEVVAQKINNLLKEKGYEINFKKDDQEVKKIYDEIQKMYDENQRESSILDEELFDLIQGHISLGG
ncbi:isopropylmalate synthase [archaeon SCG-AAA382B04]|nr:isopropylmalate synthase [archaeon SCG-AAA382B04]